MSRLHAALLLVTLIAVNACDRRRTDPPTESTTTDSAQTAQPGQRSQPGDEATPERALCSGLSGQALADCQDRANSRQGGEPAQPPPKP